MKFCISTYCKGMNYGALLQAWALGKVVQNLGHEVEYLNFYQPWSYGGPYNNLRYWISCSPRALFIKLKLAFRDIAIRKCFKPMEHKFKFGADYGADAERIVKNPPVADCYLTGSDQVWTGEWKYCAPYFLNFGPENVRRVAYAPSLGGTQFDQDKLMKALPLLRRYSAISVREPEAAKYLESLGLGKIPVVPDPTLLLTSGDYQELYKDELSAPVRKVVYLLGGQICSAKRSIDRLLSKNDLNISLQTFRSDRAKNEVVTVPQFVNEIAHAGIVITNSFHASVFAILHHRPFWYLKFTGNEKHKNDRVMNLLSVCGLESQAVDPVQLSDCQINVDWNDVDARLALFRAKGQSFLVENLK